MGKKLTFYLGHQSNSDWFQISYPEFFSKTAISRSFLLNWLHLSSTKTFKKKTTAFWMLSNLLSFRRKSERIFLKHRRVCRYRRIFTNCSQFRKIQSSWGKCFDKSNNQTRKWRNWFRICQNLSRRNWKWNFV